MVAMGLKSWSLFSGVNFINILPAHFSYKIFSAKISNPKVSFVVFDAKILYKKRMQKTLMKLTTGFVCLSYLMASVQSTPYTLHRQLRVSPSELGPILENFKAPNSVNLAELTALNKKFFKIGHWLIQKLDVIAVNIIIHLL